MKSGALCSVLLPISFLIWGNAALGQSPGDFRAGAMGKSGVALSDLHDEHMAYGGRVPGIVFKSKNPLLRLVGDRVIIDAVAAGNPNALRADLEALEMQDISQVGNVVSGLLPIASIDDMEALGSLQFARPSYAMTRTGSVDSQGDAAMHADDARALFGIDGSGITVGTLSDSFDCTGTEELADVLSGDLPAGIEILNDSMCPGTDEGRAMMQLIHDVAPSAGLAFHTAFGGKADFALGIEELAGCPPGSEPGCSPALTPADVIVDDVIYFDEPMFQDGIIAQAVDVVAGSGVSYFSSAGNNARDSYDASFEPGGSGFTGLLHDFDPGPGVDTCQTITVPTGVTIFSLQWTEPFFSVSGGAGSASDLDIGLFLVGCAPEDFLSIGGLEDNIGADPVEVFGVDNTGPPVSLGLQISHFAGPFPDLLKYVVFSSAAFSIDEFDTASSTIYGHANAAGAEAVGAAFYAETPEFGVAPPLLEPFSSAGPTPIFFDTSGFAYI